MKETALATPLAFYWQYLDQKCLSLTSDQRLRLISDFEQTDWDEPKTAIDFNNVAVMMLIEAEQCQDGALRSMNLEMAAEVLSQGIELEAHPLCTAHFALINSMTGELETSAQIASAKLIETIQSTPTEQSLPIGLVYLPPNKETWSDFQADELQQLLHAEDGFIQAQLLLTLALCRSQLAFYNPNSLRFLQLAAQLTPNSFAIHFKLGIAQLVNRQWEGLWHLQQARKLAPGQAAILQSLYLSSREQSSDISQAWHSLAQHYYQQNSESLAWKWTDLAEDSQFTYIPFENSLLLAVEPSFRSIVTSVLLAESDWFEAEMQFWRDQIQPDMVVIDVGANAGIYTFSAAQRVTKTGRVLAVEPFSACVRYLEETCRINQISWVTVCAGAASDRDGKARLALHAASELNEVIADQSMQSYSGQFEEISCFTLDSLVEQEQLNRVDWLKLDAEGHEMQVLAGSDRLISKFMPNILYENVAGAKGSNPKIAEFLQSKGYHLFRYQPYLAQLIPIQTLEDLQGTLNIIALPQR